MDSLPLEILGVIYQFLDHASKAQFLVALPRAEDLATWTNLHSVDGEGNSIFHNLAKCDHYDTIRWLSERDGDGLLAVNETGATPLHLAVEKRHERTALTILQAACRSRLVNHPDHSGRVPLHIAAMNGDRPVIHLLMSNGGDLMAVDRDGLGALQYACISGDHVTVGILLGYGATPLHVDHNGLTSLHWCALSNNREITRLLMKHTALQGQLDCADANGLTPLHHAAYWGNYDMVSILLAAGCDPNSQTPTGWTALHHAAQGGHSKLFEVLHDYGAQINQEASGNMTAYKVGAVVQDEGVIKAFEKAGADYSIFEDNATSKSRVFHF